MNWDIQFTANMYKVQARIVIRDVCPPVDLHWFFEISIRTEKKNQLVYN